MKKGLAVLFASAVVLAPATASAAPGADIQNACGASFGQLIGPAKSGGYAVHSNYAGGANAFSDPAILAAHGCGAS